MIGLSVPSPSFCSASLLQEQGQGRCWGTWLPSFSALCLWGPVPGAAEVPLAGAHLIGLGEEVHRVGSLEEVHQGEAVVKRRVTIRIAFCLQEDGAV